MSRPLLRICLILFVPRLREDDHSARLRASGLGRSGPAEVNAALIDLFLRSLD